MEPEKANGSIHERWHPVLHGPSNPMVTPLLTDHYQFTMAYAYWKAGKHTERAVLVFFFFSFFNSLYLIFRSIVYDEKSEKLELGKRTCGLTC